MKEAVAVSIETMGGMSFSDMKDLYFDDYTYLLNEIRRIQPKADGGTDA